MTTTNTQVQVKTEKQPSKAHLCWKFYRTLITKEVLEAGTEESAQLIREVNKKCKDHFTSAEVGLTDKGANTYIQICKHRMLGLDPHAGRKLANKNTRLAKKSTVDKTVEVVAEEVVEEQQPTVDLSKRWVVGSDKENLTNSFETRSEAQKYAKDNSMKWFDSKTI